MIQVLRLATRRLLVLPILLFGVTLMVFILMQFAPSDPAFNALGEGATQEQREAFAEEQGLNDPFPIRYGRFLGDLLHGDLGVTAPPSKPVAEMIGTALPLTLQLTALGIAIAAIWATILGVVAALYRDRWPDHAIRMISIAGFATPSFWLGILLIQLFSLDLGWFPSGGYVNPADSVSGWLRSLFMPALALGIPVAAQLTRVVRTSMVEELDRDYVRTAVGNGLPYRLVVARNVLRNALISPVTVLGLRVGYVLGGAVVIETIFNLPGMGLLILTGVTGADTALVQGAVLSIATLFILINMVVDLLYLLINPRIRAV